MKVGPHWLHYIFIEQNQSPSTLFSYFYKRVILDEGHIIRNPTYIYSCLDLRSSSLRAQAMFHLQAETRWMITGTPIHVYLLVNR